MAIWGYQAANVNARGRIDGRRITVDGAAAAYGARATARGTIVTPATPAEQVAVNLRGNASGLDLRRLPPALRVPRLESNLAFAYQLAGPARSLDADVELRRSTLEGATIADGTTARVALGPPLNYVVRGGVADLNVRRLGAKLNDGHADLDGVGGDERLVRDLDAVHGLPASHMPRSPPQVADYAGERQSR